MRCRSGVGKDLLNDLHYLCDAATTTRKIETTFLMTPLHSLLTTSTMPAAGRTGNRDYQQLGDV